MRAFFAEDQIEVEGEILHLVCDFRAIDVIEGVTGEKMSDILPQLIEPPFALFGKVLWGLLRGKHEGVTLDEAAGVAFGPDSQKVGLVMGSVIGRAFNIGEAKDANPPKRRGRSKNTAENG